jgi:hypothetical protein
MKFKTKEPAHGTFLNLSQTLEDFVSPYSLVMTNPNTGAIYISDARTLSNTNQLQEKNTWHENLTL